MSLARLGDAGVDAELRARADLAGVGELWLGGFDLEQANDWLWTDHTPLWTGTAAGTALAYEHFTAGAPSGTANQDCLAMLPNGEWQDADCAAPRPYACRRP